MKHLGKTNSRLMTMRMQKRWVPKPNMAPMIDCVFLLLIFFMVSTTFTPMRGIRVQLPPPVDSMEHKPNSVVIRIDNPVNNNIFGTMLLDGKVVQFDELFSFLLNTASQESKSSLTIQAGRDVIHDQVVQVMDIAKTAGMDNLVFAIVVRE